jgi:hypothetical protein
MAKENSKQRLANLIQVYEQVVAAARTLYTDETLKDWAIGHSNAAQDCMADVKQKLTNEFSINYDSADAKKKVIKEGSEVEVLVGHMDGMKGSKGIIDSYSLPAAVVDITMMDGMEMNGHKWLTNNEVTIKTK